MATVNDILMIENEYDFTTGDFSIGFSDNQHVQDIVFENKGSYKQFPLVGVGITNYLNSTGSVLLLKRDIEIQLKNDGYLINEIKFIQNEITNFTIDAIRN